MLSKAAFKRFSNVEMFFRRRNPRLIDSEQIARDLVNASDLFDAKWYLANYPDVERAGFDPALHYVRHGASEGREPGPWFDSEKYVRLMGSELNGSSPLEHFLRHRPLLPKEPAQLQKECTNLASFLRVTAVNPIIRKPFNEEHLRCFAVMERLAKQLADRALCSDNPKVTVIMPFWNRARTLRTAIDSVLRQHYQNFELILIDDGSCDESVGIGAQAVELDPRVKCIRLGSRSGVSRARNRALEVAEGELVAYLDSDNVWLEDYLGAAVGAISMLPEADAIYSGQWVYEEDEAGGVSFVRFGPMNHSLLEQHNYIDLNCLMHRRTVVEHGILFDPSIERLVDWDFILRLKQEHKVVSVPMILSKYYLGAADNTITKTVPLRPVFQKINEKVSGRRQGSKAPLIRRVAIVIPSYQVLDCLRDCLESLSEYLSDELVEVVIVDNNSDRDVIEFLDGFEHPRLRKIFNPVNYGFSFAVNQGVAGAPPDCDILILNNDARLGCGSLEALQHAAYKAADIGITVPRQIVPTGAGDATIHVPYADPNLACDVTLSSHHKNIDVINLFHDGDFVDLNFAPFFCAYIKRETWDFCGGLDYENGRHYRSDRIMCDFVKEVLRQRIVYTHDAWVYHQVQAASHALSKCTPSGEDNYSLMLDRNSWPPSLMRELGIRERPWL